MVLQMVKILLFMVTTILASVARECQKEGQIAFTYDQGPSQYTGILLTALSKAGIKATFHVIPDYLDNPVLSANLRRAATDGHLIGLFVKESITEDKVKAYLVRANNIIKQYTNYEPHFLRFASPGPSPSMLKLVTQLGYRVTSYNLDSLDYNALSEVTGSDGKGSVYQTIKEVLDQIVPPTLGSFVCVQRDLVKASVMQSAAIFEMVKAKGYKAVKLDVCLGAGDVKEESGAGEKNQNSQNKEESSADGDGNGNVTAAAKNASPSFALCKNKMFLPIAVGLVALIVLC